MQNAPHGFPSAHVSPLISTQVFSGHVNKNVAELFFSGVFAGTDEAASSSADMTHDLDLARRQRLSLTLTEAQAHVHFCEAAMKQNQAEMLELRQELVEALARLADAQRGYDQAQ